MPNSRRPAVKWLRINVADYRAQLELVCTVADAAALLGVGIERVRQFCRAGRIAAINTGRDWVLCRAAVRDFAAVKRPSGRRQKISIKNAAGGR
jgi:excisionase family DNA binding protein